MGCDIHAVIEYVYKEWDGYIYWLAEVDMNRDYLLFALMAGVRSDGNIIPVAEPRGLPSHISYRVSDKTILHVNDEIAAKEYWDECRYVSLATAKKWHAEWRVEEKSIIDVDTHSHSWLTSDELVSVVERMKAYPMIDDSRVIGIESVIKMMQHYETSGAKVRLTFWFDN